jgi:hypothetical protein
MSGEKTEYTKPNMEERANRVIELKSQFPYLTYKQIAERLKIPHAGIGYLRSLFPEKFKNITRGGRYHGWTKD